MFKSRFNKLFNQIILETKQIFSLLQHKQQIIKLLNKMLSDNYPIDELIDDYKYAIARLIYQAIRNKTNINISQHIDNIELEQFSKAIIKNVQSYDDINSTWVSFKFNNDDDFYPQTYSLYITPNLQYDVQTLHILQTALLQLQNIVKTTAHKYNIFLGVKYNRQFQQYFQQNDNIKLYCLKKQQLPILEKIEKEFLNLLPNKENNRIYKYRI